MSPSTVIRNLRCAGRMTFGLIAFGALIADVGRHMLQREAQSILQPNDAGLITDSRTLRQSHFVCWPHPVYRHRTLKERLLDVTGGVIYTRQIWVHLSMISA